MKTKKEKFLLEISKGTKTNLKANKVALALLDNFAYDDLEGLEEEASRISYSTEEWFDEKFDAFLEVRGQLRDVYINNSEAFLTVADVQRDEEILNELVEKADELGIPVDTIYPDYDEHRRVIEDLKYFEERFEEQKRELIQYGL
tara:strand:+ start:295 stop:729 length:435 start_codon:yes stop_codon:yes gene_type:complete